MASADPARRPRVWIVNHYADAPDRPSGTRHHDLARVLVGRGQRVTIFAAGFSHVTGREERLGRGRLYRIQWFGGVRFVWLRTFPYRGNTWRRPVNMLSFVVAFLLVQRRFRSPDAIIGSTVHPFAALAAWLVARSRGAAFLFEIRDLWPQTLVDLGALRDGGIGERVLRAVEAHLVRNADTVIGLMPGLRDYLESRDLPTDRIVYLPNGIDPDAFDAAADEPAAVAGARTALVAIDRLRISGRVVVGYVGSFGRVNGVATIVSAARIAEAESPGRIGLVLVGDGPDRAAVARMVGDDPAVVLCPAVPRSSVPSVLRALDATVAHATATPVYRYGLSFNKLFEYMAAGRPVVFACTSAYDPVALSGAGLTVPPDDPIALARALLAIADLPPEAAAAMGDSGRAYVERQHDLREIGAALATRIEEVAGDTKAGSIRSRIRATRG
ncbi:MAG: glycosyltransferase family 4 protein [Acidimicrobiales bacterium]